MEIIIDGTCDKCPFLTDTCSCCDLYYRMNKDAATSDFDYSIRYDYDKGHVQPEWCPLKTDFVLVKLKD